MAKSKRPKVSNEDSSSRIDRINTLPDSLLCRILSFLSTKHAVATSILSTRWRFLWTSITNLDFVDTYVVPSRNKTGKDKMKEHNFINFVNRVLVLLNPPCIQKFHLKCNLPTDIFHVNTWICAAVVRNVRELDLELFSFLKMPIVLPRILYTCNTLDVLKLSHGIVVNIPAASSISLPNLKILHLRYVDYSNFPSAGSICFPNLKALHLVYVKYANDDCLSKLVRSCPVLQNLVIQGTDRLSCIDICNPALRRLEMTCDFSDNRGCKVQIDAPELQNLNIVVSSITVDFLVENLFSLVEATVCAHNWTLRALSNVKYLSLYTNTLKALSNGYQYVGPVFRNLIRLVVRVRCCDLHVLQSLLENSDNLQHLLCFMESPCCDDNESWWTEREHVPKCLLLCLKTFWTGFTFGCSNEIALVRYILKNAKALDKMTIHAPSYYDNDSRYKVLQKISMFPRGSTTCEVAFS